MTKQTGGRRTRKANMWAKAAGEYYRSHKNDPKIKEFSDVLKSPNFKNYYMTKYGKGKGTRFSRKVSKYQREPMEEMEETNKEEQYEWVKVPKKGKKMSRNMSKKMSRNMSKKNKKYMKNKEENKEDNHEEKKQEDGWKWGGNPDNQSTNETVQNGEPIVQPEQNGEPTVEQNGEPTVNQTMESTESTAPQQI
jgi:hypothetical protein